MKNLILFLLGLAAFSQTGASEVKAGVIDLAFGNLGTVAFDGGKNPATFAPLSNASVSVPMSDGRIVVGYWRYVSVQSLESEIVFYRLLPNGKIDTSFGKSASAGGLSKLKLSYGNQLFDFLVLPEGKVLFVGSLATSEGQSTFVIGQLDANGVLDKSFGNGTGTVFPFGETYYSAIRVQRASDGSILIGLSGVDGRYIGKFLADGRLETLVLASTDILVHHLDDFRIDSQGRVLLFEDLFDGISNGARVTRFDPQLQKDLSYGEAGAVELPWFAAVRSLDDSHFVLRGGYRRIAVSSDGGVFTSGYAAKDPTSPNSPSGNWICRLDSSGKPDLAWGSTGCRRHQVQLGSYSGGLVVSGNRLVVSGVASTTLNTNDAFLMALDFKGNLDTKFGNKGVTLIEHPNLELTSGDLIESVSGYLYSGYSYPSTLDLKTNFTIPVTRLTK